MRQIKQFLSAILSASLLAIYPMTAQTLPIMPPGGPDNGTFDKSGRYPAGNVNHTSFYSSVAKGMVDMWIYTPPGYSTSQKYGVIFCYQGIGVDAGTIFYDWGVNAGIVCDNLIGEGKISKGVIIVAVDDQFAGDWSNVNDMTIRDAIPYIDSHYSTYGDADHRGLYGYSWGGGYTFNVGCANLDYFHYLSPSAAAPNKAGDNTLFPNGGAYAKQVLKCLFISWGQYDYQSIIDANVACVNYCNTNGIPNYSWAVAGQGHTAGVWRPAMWNFLQLADRAGISSDVLDDGNPKFEYASVNDSNPKQIQVTLSKSIADSSHFSGFTVKIDDQVVTIDSVVLGDTNRLVINLNVNILKENEILLSYNNGNVVSIYEKYLVGFNNTVVNNLLKGAPPRIIELTTNKNGDTLIAKFNMKMKLPTDISALTLNAEYNGNMNIPLLQCSFINNDSTSLLFSLADTVYADYQLLLSYSGTNIVSADSGLLKTFSDTLVTNNSKGLPVQISSGNIEPVGLVGILKFSKPLALTLEKSAFTLKVNKISVPFKDLYSVNNTILFTLSNTLHYGDTVMVSYTPGNVTATDGGILEAFSNFQVTNLVKEPAWLSIPGKIEAENFYSQFGTSNENTGDAGGGLNVGWIDNGDWLEYVIKNNTTDTSYEIVFRVASPFNDGKFDFYLDNVKISQVIVPNTSGWQTWQSVIKNITIVPGKHYLKIVSTGGGFNINYYDIKKLATGIAKVHEDIIKVYPNPVSKEMIIGSDGFRYNKVEIIDILGKTVLSRLTAHEPDLHIPVNLPNGAYIVKISDGKQFQLKRIIIDNN